MWKENIDKDLIIIDPDVSSKKELFEGMVNHVYNHDYVLNQKKFLEALHNREEMSSTELLPGVALPHARSDVVEKLFVCIIILKKGVDYENPEMGPAKIIFFFGCPEEQNKEYLQLLAQSSRLLKNPEFREKLLKSQTVDDVVNILSKYDEKEEDTETGKNYLLLLTLNNLQKEAEVLSAMVEVGITNASLVDSTSMAKKLAYEMPVFAGLSYMAAGKSKGSLMIFSHIQNRNQATQLAKLLKENGIDLNKKGVGFIQVIKVESVIGSFEEDIEL